jgi:ATP-dependent DNA helicase RecG
MQEITGEHAADITAVLRGLVQKQLLIPQKARRWSSYRVADPSDSLISGPDSLPSEIDSPPNRPDSPPFAVHSLPSAEQEEALPSWLDAADLHLWALAAPARGRKPRRPVLDDIVVSLCQGRWLSARQLAELLGRDPESLQTKVLASLVRSGRLRLRHPGVPNRPDQAYQSVEGGE